MAVNRVNDPKWRSVNPLTWLKLTEKLLLVGFQKNGLIVLSAQFLV